MAGRTLRRALFLSCAIAIAFVLACSAGVTVRVFDNGSNADDDIAKVWIDGQSLGYIDYNPGGTNERTWDLGIPSSGTHTLEVEFTQDEDADDLCDEHSGTFGIEFGGGGLAASDDAADVDRGSSVDISVLTNDVYVQAGATATDAIPCPSELPVQTPGCVCTDFRTTYSTTFDVSGGSLSIDRIVSAPTEGTAQIIGDEIRYTPNPDGCGTDSFTYEVDGPSASSDTATVTVTINAPALTVIDDAAETLESQAVTIDVLANDGGQTMTIDAVGPAAHGTTSIVANEIHYTPNARYEGPDRFSYLARDPCGPTDTGWVDVTVVRENHPPTANAGSFYQGIVGVPIELSASFSTDPDLGDRLEYRWDLNDDGRFDTDWSGSDTFSATYDSVYVGLVVLEVRDTYRGQPTGDVSTDDALVRIDPPGAIQVLVFEDLDGDGAWSEDEPGLAGIDVTLGEDAAATALDGRATFEVAAGSWTATIAEMAVSSLEGRAYAVPEAELSVQLGRGENALVAFPVVKTSTRLKGVVYADSNGDGELDDEDRLVGGVAVMLDGEKAGAIITDASGAFAFRDVPFGPHEIYVEQTGLPEGETPPSLLIPFTLVRTEKPEIHVAWPYDLGPEEGFLQVDVQREGEE